MSRQRQFDEDRILERAMISFWVSGYQPTSIRDIAADTGVQAQSLYNAFGNKEQLYMRALQHYVDMAGNVIDTITTGSIEAKEQLKRLLTLNWPTIEYPKGCMVVDAIGEQNQPTAAAQKIYDELFDHLVVAFKHALRQERASKSDEANIERLAQMLLTVHNGLQIDLSNDASTTYIDSVVETTLTLMTQED